MAAFNDLHDVGDLKKAFERELNKEEETAVENEQRFLKDITVYLYSQKGVAPLQGYKPEEIMVFLEKPIPEIKKCIGGEWAAMDDGKLEVLIYTLAKKVKKADKLTTW